MVKIGVNNVGPHCLAIDLHAEAEYRRSNIHDDPTQVVFCGPPIEKEADWSKKCSWKHYRDPKLWAGDSICALLHFAEDEIHQRSADLSACKFTEADRDVMKAADRNGLLVLLDKEIRIRRESYIQQSIIESR